mmetsp:Transcript_161855/g.519154  ORF Transcript_161855/g.519154 Transcript_161855/m.519154 type:complete len:82 (+) Transcript_161855:49-294(+)
MDSVVQHICQDVKALGAKGRNQDLELVLDRRMGRTVFEESRVLQLLRELGKASENKASLGMLNCLQQRNLEMSLTGNQPRF